MRYYFCVDYGGHVFAFTSEDEAFKAFKALSACVGISSYYEYTDNKANPVVSGMLHNVIKECDSSLQKRKLIHMDHIESLYDTKPEVKCDEYGCWQYDELNEDGSIPDGWQEIDDKHYCSKHHR
jgi:hypothetical protein